MIRKRVYGLTCVLMMMAGLAAHATTIVLPTDEQLIAKSPIIVEGTVVSTRPVDRDGSIFTDTVITVSRNIKGTTPETITVRELGGMTAERITKIYGTPEFTEGERVLLFLEPSPRGGYRTMDLFIGKFSEAKALNGRRLWLRENADDTTLLDADFRPIEAKNIQRDASRFETFVAARISGREAVRNYGIENPVLDRTATAPRTPSRYESNFTLIAEPTLYRWSRFDSGQSAAWYSVGTQPGYTNGGVSETQTAMNAWTGYSSAKINYTYAGVRTAAPGGVCGSCDNGVNEVLFNDPVNDIAGSWDRTKGGTVGLGGFNGVSSQHKFTATFAADDTHPAGQQNAWTITEANLAIQDAVSPANGISSTTLAEIVAHEFGHTLGFGHSADSTALMYYSVTGKGPSLRADDQVAARWLYPNGSSTPPPPPPSVPAAPTSFTATVAGNDVNLGWTDNSTNETGFAIYVNGTKVTEYGANITAGRLTNLATGSYSMYVVAFNGSGNSSQSNSASVQIVGVPVASFTVSPSTGTTSTTFVFQSSSTGTITSLGWDFGDGFTASGATVSHIYKNAGQYTVTLTATGGGKNSYATRGVSVSGPLASSFVYAPSAPKMNENVTFSDQSTGAPTAWRWTFGDGTSSLDQNPTHAYTAAGSYVVTLTAYRGSEQANSTRTVVVSSTVPNTPAVAAAFDISNAAPAIGANVTFTDKSTGAPTAWQWSFGDGTSANVQHPSHAYTNAGIYTVTLTASNATTSSVATKQVVVAASPIVAAFDISNANPAIGANVTFTDKSIGSPTSWQWSFGDGSTSAAQNPVHAYAGPGTYTVSLIASNGSTSNMASKTVTVAAAPVFRTLVSVAAQTAGVGGTSWRTELNIFNAGSQGADITFRFLQNAGGAVITRNLFLGPHQSRTYANALLDLFGVPSGAGALSLEANSAGVAADLRVTSRTFTGGSAGTYGQAVPDIRPAALERTLYLTGMSASDAFRTNVGLVNRDTNDTGVTLTLFNRNGGAVATKELGLGANSFQQASLGALFPQINGGNFDVLSMRIVADVANAISAYASVVDNLTQDPIYIQALPAASGKSLTIPVVGRAPGVNGTFWRSDVSIFNPASTSTLLTIRYNGVAQNLTLGAGNTQVLADVLARFGQTAGGGTLVISWTSANAPVVTSRTYTSVETGGTYGQSIDPVTAFGSVAFVPGLRHDGSYRSNVGFVNGGDETETISVSLLSPFGTELGQTYVTLAPNQQLQYGVAALFPGVALEGGFTLYAEGDGNAKIFAYGSMVDNGSGDPVFFAGQ